MKCKHNPVPPSDVSADRADPAVEALFVRARAHPPGPVVLRRMLRGVAPTGANRRRLWAVSGGIAACGAVAAAVVLLLSPGAQPPAFALSAVASAMRQAPVVKITVRGETSYEYETWEVRGRLFATRHLDGSQVRRWDYLTETQATYDRDRGCIMLSTCEPLQLRNGMSGATTLDQLVSDIERWGESLETGWDRRDFTQNGRQVIELTAKSHETRRYSRVLIDAECRRIVEADSNGGKRTYEYPFEGPADIYSLGVPKDALVVDGRAGPKLMKLREKVVAAQTQSFGKYRAVQVTWSGRFDVRQVITDGVRVRVESFSLPNEPEVDWATMEAMAQKYLDMTPKSFRHAAAICDSDQETRIAFSEEKGYSHRSVRPKDFSITWLSTLEGWTWWTRNVFFHPTPNRQDIYIESPKRGWVGMRTLGQANNCSRPWLTDTWFDIEHGYRRCASRSEDYPDAEWQINKNWVVEYYSSPPAMVRPLPEDPAQGSEYEVIRWAELRPGEWYPAVREGRQIIQNENGAWVEHIRTNVEDYSPLTKEVILAEPLDYVDDHWFMIPEAWLKVPVQPL